MTKLKSRVRLEVLAGQANAIANHSAQDGTTTGWNPTYLTAVSSAGFGYDGHAFKLTPDPGGSQPVKGESEGPRFDVTPGEFVNAAVTCRALDVDYTLGTHFGFYFGWYAEDGSPVGASDVYRFSNLTEGDNTLTGPESQVPPGVAYGRMAVFTHRMWPLYFFKVMIVTGATRSAVAGVVWGEGEQRWQNLLPTSVGHQIVRGGSVDGPVDRLEVGSMTSVVHDPSSTPENNPFIRPGRPIRLVRVSDDAPVFTGTIARASTQYGDDDAKPVVTINSTDAMADLARTPGVVGYTGTFRQRVEPHLDAAGVDHLIIDTYPPMPAPAVASVDASGTALTQLELARDNVNGLFYVARSNEVEAFDYDSYPSQEPVVTFSDDKADVDAIQFNRSSIVTSYDSAKVVNSILVNNVAAGAEKVYGPYVNLQSVAQWGPVSATVNQNTGWPYDIAAHFLAQSPAPILHVERLSFNATRNIDPAVELELYQAVRVKYAAAGIDRVFRVIGIEHNTTALKWITTVILKPLEDFYAPAVTVSPPPGGALAGPSDLMP